MLKKGRRDGQDGRKFHENEKKERIFPVRSSTSRTLIRRSGFTLTLGNPPASSCRVALSFPSSRVSHIAPLSLHPSFMPSPPSVALQQHTPMSLKRNSSRVVGIFRYPQAQPEVPRQCRYLKKETDIEIQREKGQDSENKRGTTRKRERGNTAKRSDRGEILFFARKTRTRRRCLFRVLSSIRNLQQVTFAGNETRNEMYVPKTRYILRATWFPFLYKLNAILSRVHATIGLFLSLLRLTLHTCSKSRNPCH